MNNLSYGALTALVGVLFFLYRKYIQASVTTTLIQTEVEDKSLQQQQLENKQKLAKVNKDLTALYEERKKTRDEYLDAQQEADAWNQQKN